MTREDCIARVRRLLAVEYSEDRHCPHCSEAEAVADQMLPTLLELSPTEGGRLTFDELARLAAHDVWRRARE